MSNPFITIPRGDSRIIAVTCKYKGTNTVIDLTGYTAKMTVKKNVRFPDSSALMQINGVINTPATGVITFSISHSDSNIVPGDYCYDVQIVNETSGDVQTPVISQIRILADVTRESIVFEES